MFQSLAVWLNLFQNLSAWKWKLWVATFKTFFSFHFPDKDLYWIQGNLTRHRSHFLGVVVWSAVNRCPVHVTGLCPSCVAKQEECKGFN